LIRRLSRGGEIVVTENARPVARIIPVVCPRERVFGALRGTVLHMAEDFDAPLDDFRDYM